MRGLRGWCVLVVGWCALGACGEPAPVDLDTQPEPTLRVGLWEGDACTGTSVCGPGLACVAQRCQVQRCSASDDPAAYCAALLGVNASRVVCTGGGRCQVLGVGVPAPRGLSCASVADCGAGGMVCDGGRCASACVADTQCVAGELCAPGEAGQGVCRRPEQLCDAQPEPDAFCARLIGDPARCEVGVCVPLGPSPARCGADEDCARSVTGTICLEGACVQTCDAASPICANGLACHARPNGERWGVCALPDWTPPESWTPQNACTRAIDPDLYCATLYGVSPTHARCDDTGQCLNINRCDLSPAPDLFCEEASGAQFVPVCDLMRGVCVGTAAPRTVLWVQDETGRPVCDASREGEAGVDLTRLELREGISGPILGHAELLRFEQGVGNPAATSAPFDGSARAVDRDACPLDEADQADPTRRMSLGCSGGAAFMFRDSAGEVIPALVGAFVDVGEYNPACVGAPEEERDVYSVWLCDALPSAPGSRSFEDECVLLSNGLLGSSRLAIF